jgi:Cu(I)/Ag(I) efflux system membrane fusion protein
VDYTGVPIRAGEPLFDLYSPQIYAGQEELIQSIRFVGDLARSSLESTRSSGTRTVDAAREKLRLLGLSATQIAAVEERGEASEHVTIQAPVSGVVLHKTAIQGGYVETGTRVYTIADLSVLWLQLDVYESDLEWVHLGQVVVFETDTNPGETFQGKVSFIDPVLTEATRSVKVRVEVQNPDGLLKPGMFARARMEADVPGESGGPPLVVPASAPLVTGARAIVYVADPDDPSTYHGREIVLGPRAGKWWVVRDGLREGESVVVRGNFKIDSELQIRAGRSMMNPAGGGPGPVPGHDHGVKQSAPIPPAPAEVSPEVRRAVDALLGEYYAVSGALSGDDHQAAVTAARALDRRARDAATLVSPDASWNTAVQALAGQAEALASAPDLETARVPLEPLSNGMIGMVRRFGTGSPSPVYVIHCPMAHGHGADWLQPHTKTVNPYYGSSMLGCGAVAETLWAAPASREKE